MPNDNLAQILGALGNRSNNNAAVQLLGQLNAEGDMPESKMLQDPRYQELQRRSPEMASEFTNQRAAIRQALKVEDEESEKAFFKDMRNVKLRLEAGDLTGAKTVLLNRRSALNRIPGANPDDVDRILNRLENEDFEGALTDLTLADNIAVQNGILPAGPERKTTVLGKDAVLVGPDGETIASNIQEERAPNVREREARIQEYMQNFNLDRAEAISRLDAQYMTDPVTGNLIAIDRPSGKSQVSERTTFPTPAPGAVPEGQTIFATLNDAVGAVPTAIAGFNKTLGQVFGTDEGVDRARADLRGLRENIITAFSKSGRPPVVEQERILERFPNFGLAESVGSATSALSSIYDDLMLQMQDDMRYANTQGIPVKDRQEALSRAGAISQTLSRMGSPPSMTIKEITSPEAIQQFDAATLKRMINNSTDEELNALSDDVYAAIQEAIQ